MKLYKKLNNSKKKIKKGNYKKKRNNRLSQIFKKKKFKYKR